jgi:alpha-tubulin suppressor-like RCC1 family protein
MAATETGVWGLQDVRDKQLASEWTYDGGGELYTAGSGGNGQLGHNNKTQYSSPKQVGTTINWSKVSSGSGYQSFAIKTDGTLWSWGRQDGGKLGQNNNTEYSSPRQIPGTDWSSISASANNCFSIRTDGTLWAWGQNYGNLGLNQPGQDTLAGRGRSSPTQVGGTTWAHVESAGTGSQFAVKTDGTLWSWGYNNDGNLGQNNKTRYSSPTQVGTDTTWSTNEVHWGTSSNNVHYAIKTDNTLWAWGYANTGDLGQNSRTYYSSPVQIPGSWQSIGNSSNTGMGIKTDGTLWSWGNGAFSALGNGTNGPSNRVSSPTQVGTDTDWSYMGRGGGSQQTAIKTDGTLYNCGRNESGGLGHNNTSQVPSMTQLPGQYSGKPDSGDSSLWIKEV